jgi:F-type H+-transporting ATPase subunit gamma
MPSLLDIRRRIRAVKSTQQITKAMKMVAASKLRRAQERTQQARPFATQMLRVLNSLAARVDPASHPLLDERTTPKAGGRVLLFVITADRGLCGSFNTNVIGFEVRYEQVNLFASVKFEDARSIARAGMDAFLNGEVDSVYLVYNEFKSVMVQRVVIERLLPIPRLELQGPEGTAAPTEYLYEPEPTQLFEHLIPSHVEVQVFRALLESNAAFFAAQMTAMDAATRNSGEMIESLTLYMNKVRQAAITREIIEVVSGAQAL